MIICVHSYSGRNFSGLNFCSFCTITSTIQPVTVQNNCFPVRSFLSSFTLRNRCNLLCFREKLRKASEKPRSTAEMLINSEWGRRRFSRHNWKTIVEPGRRPSRTQVGRCQHRGIADRAVKILKQARHPIQNT